MTDHAIAFSPAMVSAIFAGRKTMTRRLLKVPPTHVGGKMPGAIFESDFYWPLKRHGVGIVSGKNFPPAEYVKDFPPPYAPGDRLWVRETHFKFGFWEPDPTKERRPYAKRPPLRFVPMSEAAFDPPRYPVTTRQGPPSDPAEWSRPTIYRRPARFMFRKDSRLNLIVESSDFERLNSLPSYDAEAEGIAAISKDGKTRKFGIPDRDGLPGQDNEGWHWADWQRTPILAFARLWNSIHGDGAWDLNPWVSATRFHIEPQP